MLRDIAGIRLCGANFDEVTNILLLDPHEGNKVKPVKGTLLYGRNGAGKSTLAKAVRKAKGESQDTISQAEFLSINNLPIELTEEEKSHVFVFDEEYIDKNVKFHESGRSYLRACRIPRILTGTQKRSCGCCSPAKSLLCVPAF